MNLNEIVEDQNPWWKDPDARGDLLYRIRQDKQRKVLEQVLRLEDRRAVVLMGPRQVGKTVLLLQTADDLLDRGWPAQNLTYFDFSDDRLTEPVHARSIVDLEPFGFISDHPRIFLFDEIRLSPNWDQWLKQMVDKVKYRIVVTDSAASILRVASDESGHGRWDEYRLEGLSFGEYARLQGKPDEKAEDTILRIRNLPERYLSIGGFPEHAPSEDFPEVRRRLRSDIVERAIMRDLSGAGVDLQRVKELFVYLIQDSGSIFDAAKRGRDLGADPRSVREWVQLLQNTLLIVPLPRYTRYASAGLRSKPRLYAADHGLVVAFASSPSREDNLRSRVFEAVVFRHLREAAGYLNGELSYFRPSKDLEIDFVLSTGKANIAIEATSSTHPKRDKTRKLRTAGEAIQAERLLMIYGGIPERKEGDIHLIPLPQFMLDPVSFLEGNH